MPRKDYFDREGRYTGSSHDEGDFGRPHSGDPDNFFLAIGLLMMLGGIVGFFWDFPSYYPPIISPLPEPNLKRLAISFLVFWIGLVVALKSEEG